ncbi:MAG: thioesterase [Bacteroidetes bacterium MedPE-SWsnd-G2]|nr:MAG: thioesterase [Bacteroidetes bacterium MedPE-SWsnd-G2]
MTITAKKINYFLMFKLPAAYICGVRAIQLDHKRCTVSVKHRWINQNPFKSMFWAVQGMAAELTTGALVMKCIKESNEPISMLVAQNKAIFTKKATGRIYFECTEGALIKETIKRAIETKEGQTIWMNAIGKTKDGIEVSNFSFEWTLKLRAK